MPKVFISYARDESFGQQLAAQVQPQLQAAGYKVFRDVTGLSPGDRWDTKLEFELQTSDIVVLIVSERVRKSEWVYNEISMAKEIGLPIVPVISEKVIMPLWLRHLQVLDFSEIVEWDKLLRAVETQYRYVARQAIIPEVPKDLFEIRSAKASQIVSSKVKPPWAEVVGKDQYGDFADLKIKQVTQRFRYIKAGTFSMGSPYSEFERGDNEDSHQVTISQSFWLADSACTQAFWKAVMATNPAAFKNNTNNPIENVSWNDTQEFLKEINTQIPNLNANLPTEAEWEYACRAKSISPFSQGETLSTEHANYDGNYPYSNGQHGSYRKQTIPVKSLAANSLGLYEMHGNVWEWCQDAYQENLGRQAVTDPFYDKDNASKVLRGGSWGGGARLCRSAHRNKYGAVFCYSVIGFRFAIANGV